MTMEHAKAWVIAGHQVTWLTATYPGAKAENIVEGVHFVRRWGSLSIYLYAPIYLLFNARLVDVIVDEVHGFPFFSPLFTHKPVVVFIHEIAGEIWDFMFPFPRNVIGKLLERWYFRLYKNRFFWADAPSTVNELVAREIPREHCVAIPCPVVKSQIQNLPAGKAGPKSKKEKNPTFLFVSRVVRMKGIEEIIKAFSFIVRTQPNAKLWIVGSGESAYIQELKIMMQEYGIENNVKFFGNVSDEEKFQMMARAHLLFHASVKEGWGLVVLEAASVGTPSVVYNVPGLRDVVKNGITGIVLANNSPIEMARAGITLLNDAKLYRQYQQNGIRWASGLTWPDVTKKSLALLERVRVV